jgi:hypothetical protein
MIFFFRWSTFPATFTFNNWITTCLWRISIFQLYSCNKSRSIKDNLPVVLSLSGIKCVLCALMLHLCQFIAILRFHLKITFKLLSQNSSCPSICPHKTIISYCNEFQDFLKIYRENLSLKSDKNDGYFTRRLLDIFDHISPISSKNVKCFRQNLYRKSKHIFIFNNFFPILCRL